MKRAIVFAVLFFALVFTMSDVEATSARRHIFIKRNKQVRNSPEASYRGIASYRKRVPLKPGFTRQLSLTFNPQMFYMLTPSEQLEYLETLVTLSYHIAKEKNLFAENEALPFYKWVEKVLIEKAEAAGFNRGIYNPNTDDMSFDTQSLFASQDRVNHCPAGTGPCASYFGLDAAGNVLCAPGNSTPTCWQVMSQAVKGGTYDPRKNLRDAILACKGVNNASCGNLKKDLVAHTGGVNTYCNEQGNTGKSWCKDADSAMRELSTFDPKIFKLASGSKPAEPTEPDKPSEPVEKVGIDKNSCYPAAYEIMSRRRLDEAQLAGGNTVDRLLSLTPNTSAADLKRLQGKSTKEKVDFALPKYMAERQKYEASKPNGGNCAETYLPTMSDVDARRKARYWCMMNSRIGNLQKAVAGGDGPKQVIKNRWKQMVELAQQGCDSNKGKNLNQILNQYGVCNTGKLDAQNILKSHKFSPSDGPTGAPVISDFYNPGGQSKEFEKSPGAHNEYQRRLADYQSQLKRWEALQKSGTVRNKEIAAALKRWQDSQENDGNFARTQRYALKMWRDGRGKLTDKEAIEDFRNATGFHPDRFTDIFCGSDSSEKFYRSASSYKAADQKNASFDEMIAGAYFQDCLANAFNSPDKTKTAHAQDNCNLTMTNDPDDILEAMKNGPVLVHPRQPGKQKCLTVDSASAVGRSKTKYQLSATQWPVDSDPKKNKTQQIPFNVRDTNDFHNKWVAWTYKCDRYDTGFTTPYIDDNNVAF